MHPSESTSSEGKKKKKIPTHSRHTHEEWPTDAKHGPTFGMAVSAGGGGLGAGAAAPLFISEADCMEVGMTGDLVAGARERMLEMTGVPPAAGAPGAAWARAASTGAPLKTTAVGATARSATKLSVGPQCSPCNQRFQLGQANQRRGMAR